MPKNQKWLTYSKPVEGSEELAVITFCNCSIMEATCKAHPHGTVIVLPINSLEGSEQVRRKRGRPRKVVPPQVDQASYNGAMAEAGAEFEETDACVRAAGVPNATANIDLTKINIARECASLRFDILQGRLRGKDTAQLSSRRVEGLSRLASIVLESRRLGQDSLRPDSVQMSRLLELWLNRIVEVADEVAGPDKARTLVVKFREELANSGT